MLPPEWPPNLASTHKSRRLETSRCFEAITGVNIEKHLIFEFWKHQDLLIYYLPIDEPTEWSGLDVEVDAQRLQFDVDDAKTAPTGPDSPEYICMFIQIDIDVEP